MAADSKDNPDAACLPIGYMQPHTHSQPRKIIQTRDLIVILYEANAGMRQIFSMAAPAPGHDLQPWWWATRAAAGRATRWSSRRTNFRDEGWLDVNGAPLTSEGKIIERFRRPNLGTTGDRRDDRRSKGLHKPWTVRVNQRLLPDTELIEFVCLENEKFSSRFRK